MPCRPRAATGCFSRWACSSRRKLVLEQENSSLTFPSFGKGIVDQDDLRMTAFSTSTARKTASPEKATHAQSMRDMGAVPNSKFAMLR